MNRRRFLSLFAFAPVVDIQGGSAPVDRHQAEMTGRAMRAQFKAMISDRIPVIANGGETIYTREQWRRIAFLAASNPFNRKIITE